MKIAPRLLAALFVLSIVSTQEPAAAADAAIQPRARSGGKHARLRVARRQRRIIYNDDSEELAYREAATVDGFLSVRLQPLVDTQVDTICWSALAIWGDAPVYDSKVQPIFGEAAHGVEPSNRYPYYAPNAASLIKSGNCPLGIVVNFAHQNGMEAFASIRMNDVHDSFVRDIKTIWKREHPELLVTANGNTPVHKLYVTAQDYAHQAVRDRKFEIIQEIGERYDVDGFELDFIRHPVLFSSVFQGGIATAAEIDIMTNFMRRVRGQLERRALLRKRPILIAVRIPDTFAKARRIGLDLETWLQEDLVDMLIVGGGYTPYSLKVSGIVNAAHQHDVLVYPCLNWGPLRDVASEEHFHLAARALATKWRRAGADGVHLWNLGTSFLHQRGDAMHRQRLHYYQCLYDIGALATLEQRDRLYVVDGPVFAPYVFVTTTPSLPATLKPSRRRRLAIDIADEVKTTAGRLDHARLEVTVKGGTEGTTLKWNDRDLSDVAHVARGQSGRTSLLKVRVPIDMLQNGANQLMVTAGQEELLIERVHLWLVYARQ